MEDNNLFYYYKLEPEDISGVNILKSRFNRLLMVSKGGLYSSEQEKELALTMLKELKKRIDQYE